MNETKKTKFPIAAVFTVILAHGLIENLVYLLKMAPMLDHAIGHRMVVEFGHTNSVPHILYQALSIGSMVLLAVLLFMRKRNGLLVGVLVIQTLLPAFTLVSFLLNFRSRGFMNAPVYRFHFGASWWLVGICGCYMLEILFHLLITFMAATPCDRDGGNKGRLHKIWFLPGILSFFIAFAYLVGDIYFMSTSEVYNLTRIFLVPMAFLLGWWLTHPYKKDKPIRQAPAAQPYNGQPYQNTYAAYPQMGYVQDAPSGGMTALGFFVPVAGLILYLVWKDQTPLRVKSAGKGALIGAIVMTALSITLVVLANVIPLLIIFLHS